MLELSETANDRRNRIAAELLAQQLAQSQFQYQGHSPVSTFDFSPGDMPSGALPEASLSTPTPDLFDPGGTFAPSMQAPTPTARDAFDNSPVQDWGGVFSPDRTMSAPSLFAAPDTYDDTAVNSPAVHDFNAPSNMPEFNGPVLAPGEQAPSFNTPSFQGVPAAPGEQDASLTAPSMGAVDFAGLGGLGGLAGLGGVDTTGGGGAVGGMDTSGGGSSASGSSGVG